MTGDVTGTVHLDLTTVPVAERRAYVWSLLSSRPHGRVELVVGDTAGPYGAWHDSSFPPLGENHHVIDAVRELIAAGISVDLAGAPWVLEQWMDALTGDKW